MVTSEGGRWVVAVSIAAALGVGLCPRTAEAQERACGPLAAAGEACLRGEGWVLGPAGPTWAAYEWHDGERVLQGDILVAPAEPPAGPVPRSAIAGPEVDLWPGGVIPYEIDPAFYDPAVLIDAIQHVELFTAVRLVPRTTEQDFVRFVTDIGCSSYVGRIGGEQWIRLNPGCVVGETVHEIGHAAGLWHEQMRLDRDEHVEIHWENVWPGLESAFDQYAPGTGVDQGPYDAGSLMHYHAEAFSVNGLPTISPRVPGETLGQRVGFTPGDLDGIAELYGAGDAATLADGEPLRALRGARGSELRAVLDVPESVDRIAFEVLGSSGDADLYVRFGAAPTATEYDCRPFAAGSRERCSFPDPEVGAWHVMVRAEEAYTDLELVGGAGAELGVDGVTGRKLRIKQRSDEAGLGRIRFKSKDPRVTVPGDPGADPTELGGRVHVGNPRTGEIAVLELPAAGWSRTAKGLRFVDEFCKVRVGPGKLELRCRGADGELSLDESNQGELSIRLELGFGAAWCSVFGGEIRRDRGFDASAGDDRGTFSAKQAPRPESCPL